ncbi:MAG: uracil-DNA glycosylase [Proteobacteria bacterium]|nr:uracil-DNA glycosylase [Pseudomonadota bacterium]NIS71844.1 uracil-DNA glycosylase [Pseudomonadota bacterium]
MKSDVRGELLALIEHLRSYVLYQEALGLEAFPRSTLSPQTLTVVREELGDCHRCRLSGTRKNIVFGEGNQNARLVFVGEGPGHEEDLQGRPFVGKAGQLLDRIIVAIRMKRDEVYITNVVKCRPPNNRVPWPDEIACCYPFLEKQLRVIRPKIICALGSAAAQTLLHTEAGITSVRGTFHSWQGIPVMPTFHPAYLLRNPEKKKQAWGDMKAIQKEVETAT